MSVLGPGRLLLRVHQRLGVSAAAPAAPLTARASDVRFRVDSGAGPRALLGCLRFPDGRAVDEGGRLFSRLYRLHEGVRQCSRWVRCATSVDLRISLVLREPFACARTSHSACTPLSLMPAHFTRLAHLSHWRRAFHLSCAGIRRCFPRIHLMSCVFFSPCAMVQATKALVRGRFSRLARVVSGQASRLAFSSRLSPGGKVVATPLPLRFIAQDEKSAQL